MKGSYRILLLTAIVFVIGFVSGMFVGKEQATISLKSIREESSGYKFINPLLFSKVLDDQTFPEYLPLKRALSDYVGTTIRQDKASAITVYFRNLDGGEWISINPDKTFSPASMLKVVTLISVLRVVENKPSLLSERVTLRGDDKDLVGAQVWYPTTNPIRSGNTYTVETLLEHLITESDNVANVALSNLIGDGVILKTYADLQLPSPNSIEETRYTAEQYSYLFRILYNGTYLSHDLSEKALTLLSQTKFTKGITAGVPSGVTVSHKFGVRTILQDGSTPDTQLLSHRELHDCGVVYYPENPYFLCVMTEGSDFTTLENIIKDISEISWSKTEELHKK